MNLFINDNPHVLVDNIDMEKFDLCVMERPDIPTPKRQQIVTDNKLSQRGTNRVNTGWGDIEVDVKFNYLNTENIYLDSFRKQFYNIRQHLLNAKTIRFNDDLAVEYRVKLVTIGDATSEIIEHGVFTVTFTCDPFPYKIGDNIENTLKAGSKILLLNDGNYTAFPTIKLKPKLNTTGTFPSLITLKLKNNQTNYMWQIQITNWGTKNVKNSTFVLDSANALCYFIDNTTGQWRENWTILNFDDYPYFEVGEYTLEYQHSTEGGTNNAFRMECTIDRGLVY